MKHRLIRLTLLFPVLALIFGGCSSDAITDSLSIHYTKASVTTETAGAKTTVAVNLTVRIINRTERQMNVAFMEGAIYDAQTKEALARFRPIIPQSYGSISTAQLMSKQTKDFPVVTPLGLGGVDPKKTNAVVIKLSFQTTDGYRTEVSSGPVRVVPK